MENVSDSSREKLIIQKLKKSTIVPYSPQSARSEINDINNNNRDEDDKNDDPGKRISSTGSLNGGNKVYGT